MTADELRKILPYSGAKADLFAGPLTDAMAEFDINTPARQAAFIAQVGHESEQLAGVEESLNYRTEVLIRVWPTHFPTMAVATEYAHKPERIANRAYANRMGNGDEESGDGWKFRGAGLIQLTGKENQLGAGLYFDVDLEHIGDWLRTPEGACRSAAWIWKICGCNEAADRGDFDGVSDLINIGRKTAKVGDAIGYADRLALFQKAREVLA